MIKGIQIIVCIWKVTISEELLTQVLEHCDVNADDDDADDEKKYTVIDLFRYKNLRAKTWYFYRGLRLIHTTCIWCMQLRHKCTVWKNRKIRISAEMQLSAAATCIKYSLCESAFKPNTLFFQNLQLFSPKICTPKLGTSILT